MYLISLKSKRNVFLGTAALLPMVILMLNACAATPRVGQPTAPSTSGSTQGVATVAHRLNKMVGQWTGTPHRLGGNGPDGIDCSGFVQRVYRELFDIELPRSTATQVRVGKPVGKQELRVADLIFFKPPHKIRHVGIYMGQGQFAHASSSRGVTVSRLETPYWHNAYWTAKRVLPAQ